MALSRFNGLIIGVLAAILAVSLFNTYSIYVSNNTIDGLQNQRDQDVAYYDRTINQTNTDIQKVQNLLNGRIDDVDARLPIEQYDCIIYRVWNYQANVSEYWAKNGKTGIVEQNSTDAALVFNQALLQHRNVYVKADDYNVTSNIFLSNKKNARIDSDGATLFLYGNKIVVQGNSHEESQYNQISGLIIVNGTVRVENSWYTTLTNMILENCTVGIELANTNGWTEGTRLDTIHFDKCVQGLVFRTNTSDTARNSTGSYSNTGLTRCYFNQLDNSIGITVEKQAEFTDSQMQDVRFWLGEFGQFNQTGLWLYGSMYKTVLGGVVFESFATQPLNDALIYGIRLDNSTVPSPTSPTLDGGINFLGNWTARIYNANGVWVNGVGGVFKLTNVAVPVGVGDYGDTKLIHIHPATITTFNPKITVDGTFQNNETITVSFRLEFIDNTRSSSLEKSFNRSESAWFTNDDFLQLFCSPNIIYCILVEAKSSMYSDATVTLDMYGTCS